MKSFNRGFERLPKEYELDPYRGNQSQSNYQVVPQPSFQASANLNHPIQFSYEPEASNQNDFNNDNQRQQHVLPPWTVSPLFKALGFTSHLILTLMPVAFILLAFMALSVDGEPLSERGNVVYQAAKLGPTIFPIVFAAVVGRLMKTFALWRAERGSTIGLLEQLNGSQNLLAAIERSFVVADLWGWGIAIILLWALSPLGGQSSLRVLDLTEAGDAFNQQLRYFDTDTWNNTAFQGASAIASGLPAIQAIYQACLLAPASISRSPADIWGNVKIPLMQAQSAYTGSDQQDWIKIEHGNSTVYSSLTGIIISGLRSDTTANFTLETSYLNLTCPPPVVFAANDANTNITSILNAFQNWMGDVLVHRNKSRSPFDRATSVSDGDWSSFTVDTNFNFTSSGSRNTKSFNLIYAARNVNIFTITAYNCSVGLSHIEASVGCDGMACRVDRMRPSRLNTEPSVSTPLNQDSSLSSTYNLINNFPWLSGTVHPADTTPADYYVAGNSTPFQPGTFKGTNYTNIRGAQVAQRLGTLLNTVWQSSIAQSSIASPPPDRSAFEVTYPPFYAKSTTAVMRVSQVVYRANKTWVGLTGAISLILLGCGIAGMAFRYLTTAPDILGYVSTMTRDNPFFNDQRLSGADGLDGLERARLLRDAVVQISDVKPWQGGHIALKSVVAGDSRKTSRLRRGWKNPSALVPPG